jgi:methane/ammonia monooxygenase subunit A
MASTPAALSAAERQHRLELRELLNAKYIFIDRTWDAVFWITAIFIVAGAADITKLLFAGDWDFWTDWKDPQWWPVVTAFATIIIPSALQYIQWVAWRFPTGATYTCCCLFLASWIGRFFQWHVAETYPLNFVWPISTVPAAIILDWILMKTRSFILTSLIGGGAWAILVWAFN